MSTRTCSVCGTDISHRSSRALYCGKSCAGKAWYAAHAEEQRARIATWQADNRERAKSAAQRWKNNNRDRTRQIARDGYARNPETAKRSARARRARANHCERFAITDRDWIRLVARYGGSCFHCGRAGRMTRDHVIPLARGGRDSIGNLVPACGSCNSARRDRLLIEWSGRRGGF